MHLGFIGLGVMGCPMAGHLITAGHDVWLHSRSSVPHDLVQIGGRACDSAREVAEAADIIFLMLPNTPDVERVLFGPDGIRGALKPGKTVVDMSSISPLATQRFAKEVEAAGATYLDAPVSGGEVGAKAASLTIMVGGSAEAFACVEPLLRILGKNVTHVGRTGDGQTAKVANQIVVALTIEAVAEALVFAARAGADPAKVRQALMGGFAASRVLEVHGERMINRSFKPGFRIELHQKDLDIALSSASDLGFALPSTALTQLLFGASSRRGCSRLDHSALVIALEQLAGIELHDKSEQVVAIG